MPELIGTTDKISSGHGFNRRAFLKSIGGGMVVLFAVREQSLAQESGHAGRRQSPELPKNVAAWLHIASDGTITGFTGKVEVGQNSRTSLTQAVADELRCAPESVRLVMGDTERTPWDMGTFGSRTTPTMAPEMRKMAAAAREAMIDAAAAEWKADRKQLQVTNGCVVNPASGAKSEFGKLAAKINWITVTGNADFVTPADRWQVAGKSVAKVNAKEIVTGQHKYTSDFTVPGMLYGRVLRAPSFKAKLVSVDTTAAAKIPGVAVVRDGDFVGVAATDEHKAQKALLSIEAKWDQQKQISARDLDSYIKQNAGSPPAPSVVPDAAHRLQSTYTVAYIAHVPLEPRAAVAQFEGGKLTVWATTQRPFGVRSELAAAFKLPEDHVRVLMPDAGSAYGGKHSGEHAVEAARLAKGAGKPVKLIWTREEEFTWAYFRPAGIIDVRSAADKDGMLKTWEAHNYLSGPAGLQTPYAVPDPVTQFHPVDSPLREGSYRALASTANHFARESHMDELAAAVGMDPLAFRLKNLKDDRLRAVLSTAAERFEWTKHKSSPGRGFGLACGSDKGGHVACFVEVSIGSGRQVRVERVVEAWECGAIVNPEHLKNQVEGAVMMGLGGALFEAIDFDNGRILNARLSQYRVPHFHDVPKIDVILIDRKDLPSAGAGEIPIVGIAPAIANAIYKASGARIRSMPILPAFLSA